MSDVPQSDERCNCAAIEAHFDYGWKTSEKEPHHPDCPMKNDAELAKALEERDEARETCERGASRMRKLADQLDRIRAICSEYAPGFESDPWPEPLPDNPQKPIWQTTAQDPPEAA